MSHNSLSRRDFLRRSATLGAVAIGGPTLLTACPGEEEDTLARARDQGFIRVGFANEAPYGFADEAGNLTGQAPEVARVVLRELGIEDMDGVVTEFGSLIPGLQARRFDLIAAGMFLTPERCEQILFSDPDYCAPQGLLVESGNPLDVHDYDDVAANPDVTIDATIFNYPEYVVDLQTRASSGTMPDIVGLQPGALTQQYRENLMPLEDCAADTWGDDWESRFFPIGLEQARMGNPEGDEHYYALPLLVQTVNLWANSDLLDEAGVEPPATWDDLVSAVDALGGGSAAPFLLPAKDSWLRNVVFLQIVNNVEPGLVYRAETGEASWTDPAVVEGF
jgi:hypothetical protein